MTETPREIQYKGHIYVRWDRMVNVITASVSAVLREMMPSQAEETVTNDEVEER